MNDCSQVVLLAVLWLCLEALAFNNARYENDCYDRVDLFILSSSLFFPLNALGLILVIAKVLLHRKSAELVLGMVVTALLGFLPIIPMMLWGRGRCSTKPPEYTYWARWLVGLALTMVSVVIICLIAPLVIEYLNSRAIKTARLRKLVSAFNADDREQIAIQFWAFTSADGSNSHSKISALLQLFLRKASYRAEGTPNCRICNSQIVGRQLAVRTCCDQVSHFSCLFKSLHFDDRRCPLCRTSMIQLISQKMR